MDSLNIESNDNNKKLRIRITFMPELRTSDVVLYADECHTMDAVGIALLMVYEAEQDIAHYFKLMDIFQIDAQEE